MELVSSLRACQDKSSVITPVCIYHLIRTSKRDSLLCFISLSNRSKNQSKIQSTIRSGK